MNEKVVSLEDCACPLGCAPDDELLFSGRDRLHDLPGIFQVVKCRACGLMRTNPRPTPEAIGFYYPENYGPYQSTRVDLNRNHNQHSPLKRTLRKLFKRIFQLNIERIPAPPDAREKRLLEIGCASGAFLHRMAGEGWQVSGIEFSEEAAKRARALGYTVHAGSLETTPAPASSAEHYDLIAGWMVLEHLHDPVGALRQLHDWAKPGARLALSVPNANSLEFSVFRDAWFALHLPNHLFHFTPRTLSTVLEAGGWRVEKLFHQREISNLVASIGYVMKDRQWFPGLANKLIAYPWSGGHLYVIYHPLACLLGACGQTGRMTVWAKRTEDD